MQIKQEFGLALGKWITLRPRQFTEKRGDYLVYKDKFMWEIHICFHCHNPCQQEHNHPTPHPPKMGKGGWGVALYLIAITNCTTISSFNDTYSFSIHPEIQDLDDFNITLQMISPTSHLSLCCPLKTPYHHNRSDHQSVSIPNSSASLSFSSNITTEPCQFLPKIKMFLPEHIKLSSTNLLTKT